MSGNLPEITLERSAVLQSAVNDFTFKLLSIDDKAELLWYVARKIVGDLGFTDCVIYRLDRDTQILHQIAAIGDKNPDGNVIDNYLEIPVGKGITGHVARSKQAIIIDDLSIDDRYISDKTPMLSEICVPLIVNGDVIGLIDCEDERPAHFTEQHLDMLQRVAEITSIKIRSIENAKATTKHASALQTANEELRRAIAEHEHIEKKLELSHARLADFSSAAADWYWEQDANFRYTDATSPPVHQKFDFIDPVFGQTRWEAMNADIINDEHWRAHYEDHLAQRSFHDFRYSIEDDDGNIYYLSATGAPSFDKDGQFTGYRGVVSDVTELVQTHNTNARFLQALDQTSEGLILWDENGELEVCNMGFKELAGALTPLLVPGLSYENWLRENLAHDLVPEAKGREEAWIKDRLANFHSPNSPTELLRDGRWNLYVLSKLPDGSTIQRIIDINDLKLDRERFELATKGAGVGVWEKIGVTDEAIWSDSYFDIFGLTRGEVEPSTSGFLDLVHNEDRVAIEKIIRDSEAAGVEHDFECRIRRKDGTLAWVYSYGKLITVAGQPHWFGILVNIDKQKNAETAKNQFISTMNHELRTPLTAVIGLTDLLIEGAFGDIPTQAKEMLALSKKNSDRLLLLINDILEIDRLKAGQVEFHTEIMTSETILIDAIALNNPYANDFNVTLKNMPHGDPFNVLADPNRIQQVFSNLISNAAKFSPAGSIIEISAKLDSGFGVFSVRDFGAGMPDDFREKAFKRFTQIDSSDTRQVGGSGLGLSITKSIIEFQGGEIDFETELGVGTTFWFSVPLAPE